MRIEVDINGKITEHEDATGYTPSVEELVVIKVLEYKDYLSKTDHKFYGDYVPKDGEDLNVIKDLRSIAREYIRNNS